VTDPADKDRRGFISQMTMLAGAAELVLLILVQQVYALLGVEGCAI